MVPYVLASCVILLICLGFYWWVKEHQANNILEQCKKGAQKIKDQTNRRTNIRNHIKLVTSYNKKFDEINKILDSRYDWTSLYNSIQDSKPIDVWVTKINRVDGDGNEFGIEQFSDADQVDTLKLYCFLTEIKESYDAKGKERFVNNIFTDQQIKSFSKEIQKRAGQMGERGVEYAKKMEKLLYNEDNLISHEVNLYKIFESSLEFNDKISSSEVGSIYTTSLDNLKYFFVIIKLEKPIVIKR